MLLEGRTLLFFVSFAFFVTYLCCCVCACIICMDYIDYVCLFVPESMIACLGMTCMIYLSIHIYYYLYVLLGLGFMIYFFSYYIDIICTCTCTYTVQYTMEALCHCISYYGFFFFIFNSIHMYTAHVDEQATSERHITLYDTGDQGAGIGRRVILPMILLFLDSLRALSYFVIVFIPLR